MLARPATTTPTSIQTTNGGVLAAKFIESKLEAERRAAGRRHRLLPTTSVNAPRTNGFTKTVASESTSRWSQHLRPSDAGGRLRGRQGDPGGHPKSQQSTPRTTRWPPARRRSSNGRHKNPFTGAVLVGFNGDPIGLTKLMEDGKIAADVAQNPFLQGDSRSRTSRPSSTGSPDLPAPCEQDPGDARGAGHSAEPQGVQ